MALSTHLSQTYTLRAITRTDPKVWIKAEKDSQNTLYNNVLLYNKLPQKLLYNKLPQKLLAHNTNFTHFLSVTKHDV